MPFRDLREGGGLPEFAQECRVSILQDGSTRTVRSNCCASIIVFCLELQILLIIPPAARSQADDARQADGTGYTLPSLRVLPQHMYSRCNTTVQFRGHQAQFSLPSQVPFRRAHGAPAQFRFAADGLDAARRWKESAFFRQAS